MLTPRFKPGRQKEKQKCKTNSHVPKFEESVFQFEQKPRCLKRDKGWVNENEKLNDHPVQRVFCFLLFQDVKFRSSLLSFPCCRDKDKVFLKTSLMTN